MGGGSQTSLLDSIVSTATAHLHHPHQPQQHNKRNAMSLLPLFLLPVLISLPAPSDYEPVSVLIDCGGSANFTTTNNNNSSATWLSDRYYSSGAPGVVAEPHAFPQQQQRTLRFFHPSSAGARNCYSIPLPRGVLRYHLRLFTVYDNYDSKLRPPSFDVALAATLLLSWRSPWPPSAARYGAFSDLFAFSDRPSADVCFRSVASDAPVVASIELHSVDPLSYNSPSTGRRLVLVNYGRFSCGASDLLPAEDDRFARIWQPDAAFLASASTSSSVSTSRRILGTDLPPNHFPMQLYQSATVADAALVYALDVDVRTDYMLWLHFAEIDPAVTSTGQRVFDVMVDGKNVTRIDIYKEVGSFAAFKWQYVARNVSRMPLVVRLVPVFGRPMICGIENYAMVPVEEGTDAGEVEAMVALKESLGVPDRMGWNGDPCAPSGWDAWEGVTCMAVEGKGYVITRLDLSSQALKGYISDKISQLSNLVSLNMSFNSLKGPLPQGINQASLVRLDLSGNKLYGNIPASFGSSNMQLVLLNDNELEGQVPGKLYSVGVHGGEIDLSGNKGLCGVPSLPTCPYFWQKRDLTIKGKIAIGLVSVAFACFIILFSYILCRRRGRAGYDFAHSDDLASVAAIKRPRYQRQKTLMQLEMESQHAKGFPSSLTPF